MFPKEETTRRLPSEVLTVMGPVIVAFPFTRSTICFPPETVEEEIVTLPVVRYTPDARPLKEVEGEIGFNVTFLCLALDKKKVYEVLPNPFSKSLLYVYSRPTVQFLTEGAYELKSRFPPEEKNTPGKTGSMAAVLGEVILLTKFGNLTSPLSTWNHVGKEETRQYVDEGVVFGSRLIWLAGNPDEGGYFTETAYPGGMEAEITEFPSGRQVKEAVPLELVWLGAE